MGKAVLYIAASADGYIAREDGSVDWLDDVSGDGGDNGYSVFYEEMEGCGSIRDVFSDGEYLYFVTNNTDGRGNPADGDDKLYRVTE
ncbi:hypothetical protein BTO30_06450 [Domibacillus antri]|uniref:Uncharacterized protein n=1 Tax=Domibacillus antri TaxID=1714264 RepID=A0A1Q8Q6P6_9BACI|nr:hypothetical protein BTO30_06450 [Domibacillus antri]